MFDWLNDDQRAMQDMARIFAQKEVEPLAVEIDMSEQTPRSLVDKTAEFGLFGLYTPEEYGGSGADIVTVCLVMEEISKASPAYAGMLTVQSVLCPATVNILGTQEQKQRLLPKLVTGEQLMAYSQSEPGGAANIAKHLTRALPDGDGWRLDGSKLFCTQGEAKIYLVMCKTRDHEGKDGYGCLIVERDDDGFDVAPYEHKLGWRGTNTGPIAFNNVRVDPDDVLGNILTGGVAHRMANHANLLTHVATSIGCAQGMFDKTLEYVKERNLYGKEMGELQPVGYWMAESHARISACRSWLYDVARSFDNGNIEPASMNALKAWVGDTCFEVCSKLLQLWGGSGIMDSTGVNRYMRDAKAKCIAEGSSEIHYAIVYNQLFHGSPTLVPPSMAGGNK